MSLADSPLFYPCVGGFGIAHQTEFRENNVNFKQINPINKYYATSILWSLFVEGVIPIICPICSAVFVITEYIPDQATLYMRCPVCKRKLRITPELVELDDDKESSSENTIYYK